MIVISNIIFNSLHEIKFIPIIITVTLNHITIINHKRNILKSKDLMI